MELGDQNSPPSGGTGLLACFIKMQGVQGVQGVQEMNRSGKQEMEEVQGVGCRVEEVQGVGSSVQASLREDWEAERWTDVVLVGGDGVRWGLQAS